MRHLKILLLTILSVVLDAPTGLCQFGSPYQKGLEYLGAGKSDLAERSFREALNDPAAPPEIHYHLAWIYLRSGQRDKAAESASRFLEARPESADGQYVLGSALFGLGKFGEAITPLRKSVEVKSDNADAFKILGLCYFLEGQQSLAERALSAAVKLNPQSTEAHYFLGRIYYTLNIFDKARLAFETTIKLDPQFMKAYDNLGLALDALGRDEEAEKFYRKAIALNERLTVSSEWPFCNFGEFLLKRNRATEAVDYLKRAIALKPAWGKPRVFLGKAYLLLGSTDKALAEFTQSAERDPEYAEGYYQLGQLYRRMGNLEASDGALKRFRELRNKEEQSEIVK